MASDDDTLVDEARTLTNYDDSILSESEFRELIEIGKEELRAALGEPSLTFYQDDRYQATRALFWFVCIAAKVRVGELGGLNLTVESLEAQNPGEAHHSYWFRNFQQRLRAAGNVNSGGASSTVLSRTNRTYGE